MPIPKEAWVFAWSCLAVQVLNLLDNGRQDDNLLIPSMLLGAAVVGWFAHGVVRARMVRVWFVGIVLSLIALFALVAVLDQGAGGDWLDLLLAAAQLGFFVAFLRTPYFTWRRGQPRDAGPSVAGLVMIAVVVGMIGGYVGASDDGVSAEVEF